MIKDDHPRSWSTLPGQRLNILDFLILAKSSTGALPDNADQLHLTGLHVLQAAGGGRVVVHAEGGAHEEVPAAPGQPPQPTDQST